MHVNKKFVKILAFVLILSSVLFFIGRLFLRGTDIAIPSLLLPTPGARLLMSMDGFRFVQSENGNNSWRMNAKTADLYENKEAHLKEIEILFKSTERDKKEATILGEQGTMDTSTGNASIRREIREVRAATSDGYLLTTNSLNWKAKERIVWTTEPFKLLGKEMYLEGIGFSANVDMRTMVVNNDVKAVLQE